MEILHIENLNFRYPKAEKDTLHNISLNIGQGDFTVICGRNGSCIPFSSQRST